MKRAQLLCLPAILVLMVFANCSKKSNPTAPVVTPTTPSVYVGGCYQSGSRWYACYWKGATRVELPGDGVHDAEVYGIAVGEGKAFCGGNCFKPLAVPCYWVDTIKYDLLAGSSNTYVSAIAVDGGTVYCVGCVNGVAGIPLTAACYWEGATMHVLASDTAHYNVATGIAVSGGTVYCCGYEYTLSGWFNPYYWTGGVMHSLPHDTAAISQVRDIATSGVTVYTCGTYRINGRDIPCYWVDTVKHDLSVIGSGQGDANCITVAGSSVYIGGYVDDGTKYVPCYWSGTTRHDLTGGTGHFNSVVAITVNSGVVYCAGNIQEGGNQIPCYWQGETRHDIPVDSLVTTGLARGIAVQ